jgi:hypothetical protein
MSYNLFLDDIRVPIDCNTYINNPIYVSLDWVVVRSYDEFVKTIVENGMPDTLSFDHDLSDTDYQHQHNIDYNVQEKTGFHCAKWLINYCMDNNVEVPVDIFIHSMNPVGSANIKSLFDTYNKYRRI